MKRPTVRCIRECAEVQHARRGENWHTSDCWDNRVNRLTERLAAAERRLERAKDWADAMICAATNRSKP